MKVVMATTMETWAKDRGYVLTIGDFLRRFEELAEKDEPFHPDYPIVRFHRDS